MMWLEALVEKKVISYCSWHLQHRKNTLVLQQQADDLNPCVCDLCRTYRVCFSNAGTVCDTKKGKRL